ncbi:oligopeptide ABC transporter permease [Evansella tamaricis]|uniref:ABC transporter permease n=1 Tax=Evansella tamaricis TaxID=2069301 RepID=A0ABS6JEZ1_9BACI|nr:oligopeptide ABC transporter permease [Evansella tamaricis]MBU9711789.1 ABC transporter permease [Evansella tamaricis]
MESQAQRQIDPTPDLSDQQPEKSLSPFQLAMRRFLKNKLAIVGIIILAFFVLVAIFADVIATHSPTASNMYKVEAKADGENWLGTDSSGRDNFSRLVHGSRISLTIGFFAMLFTLVIGTALGSVAGYYGGKIDGFIMRVTDLMMILPFLLLVLTVIAILQKINITIFITIIALTSWPTLTRLIRATFLSLREKEYILGARSIGASDMRIIFKHFLPNAVGPIIVNATLMMATMIIIESALSFIGFGIPQPTPTWGNMVTEANSLRMLQNNWESWLPPGLAILLTVLSINFIGDGLRDAFDPKSNY